MSGCFAEADMRADVLLKQTLLECDIWKECECDWQ